MFTEKANVICYHCACKVPNSDYCFNCGKKINPAFSGLYNAVSNPVHQHKNVSHIDQTEYKRNRYKTGMGTEAPARKNSVRQSRYSSPNARFAPPSTTSSNDREEFVKKYQQREYFDRGLQAQSIKKSKKNETKIPSSSISFAISLIIFILILLIPRLINIIKDVF